MFIITRTDTDHHLSFWDGEMWRASNTRARRFASQTDAQAHAAGQAVLWSDGTALFEVVGA